jgi:biotin transport system substrate-specific component
VPLALGNFFAVLGGLLLGPVWGAVSALFYILVGALGFPVFSGGRGGVAHLAGPTGGYLAGYVVGAFLAGLMSRRRKPLASAVGSIVGFIAVLALGALGLVLITAVPPAKAMLVGILPFLPGDAVKAVLAALISYRLGPFVDSLTAGPSSHG